MDSHKLGAKIPLVTWENKVYINYPWKINKNDNNSNSQNNYQF